jgi:hypothetical protein
LIRPSSLAEAGSIRRAKTALGILAKRKFLKSLSPQGKQAPKKTGHSDATKPCGVATPRYLTQSPNSLSTGPPHILESVFGFKNSMVADIVSTITRIKVSFFMVTDYHHNLSAINQES